MSRIDVTLCGRTAHEAPVETRLGGTSISYAFVMLGVLFEV